METISPKVHSSSITAGFSGAGAAVGVIWLMQALGVPEAQFTPERVAFLAGACATVGGYLGGYFKKE